MRTLRTGLLLAVVAAGPAAGQSFDGVWRTEGYGQVLRVRGDSLNAFDVTQSTCVPSWSALRIAPAGTSPAFRRVGAEDVFTALPGTGNNQRRLHPEGTASDIIVNRIERVPAICDRPTPNTPRGVLDAFAEGWSEHYILFDQKKVDWPAVVARARAALPPPNRPDSLFALLTSMIEPFRDAHTNVTAPDLHKNFFGFRAGTDASIPGGIARLAKNGFEQFFKVEVPKLLAPTNKQLTRPPRTWCNGLVQFSTIGDRIGYLRVLTFSGYTDKGGYAAERQALDAALDTVFAGAAKWRGLIVDVRINFGGSDPLALAIADRLATAEYVAYTKQARADPVDRNKWTPGQPSVVRPSSRPGFRGPVVELIGPLTISAGETFTQALMGRTPKIIRIGEPTQGVFSDVLGRKLPNGWQFGLPNEVFRDASGKTFDGPGIPPDVMVPVLAVTDVAAGKDPGLAAAVKRLNGQ